jgi:superfamily II DNA/RNA helicase
VINFDPPEDRDAYVHRVGRTARAGRPGIGITLVGADQRREVSALAHGLGIDHGLGSAGALEDRAPAPRRGGPARTDRPPRHARGARHGATRSYGHRKGGR